MLVANQPRRHCYEMPRSCSVEFHADRWAFLTMPTETSTTGQASSVNLHGTSPWHPLAVETPDPCSNQRRPHGTSPWQSQLTFELVPF